MTMQRKRKRGHGALRNACLLAFALTVLGPLVQAGPMAPSAAWAQSAMHEVSWAYAAPENVSRFVIYISATNGDAAGARQVDVGKPPSQPTSGGTMQVFRAIVSARLTDYIAVGAIGTDGTVSPLSAWSPLPPSQPGQPILIP